MQLKVADTGEVIAGESADAGFPGQIQLSSVSWDMGREKGEAGSGSTRGRVEPGEFEISKLMDTASTSMLSQLRFGTRLSAVVTLVSPDANSFKLTITLTNARINDFKVDAKDGEKSGEVKEDWTFTYSDIKVEYKPPEGAPLITMQKRTTETKAKDAQEAIMEAFKALDPPKRISVAKELKASYSDAFKG